MDTTQAALVVAALGILVAPFTAWLTYRWTRDSEKGRRDHELKLEAARWERDDAARRLKRGEDAANELVTVVDTAHLKLREWDRVEQAEFAPYYHDIRRLALLLTDDTTRDRMLEVASAVYFHGQAEEVEPALTRWSVAYTYASASHEVLRAYMLGRPCPDTPRLARVTALINEGGKRIWEEIGEDEEPDPLADPQPTP